MTLVEKEWSETLVRELNQEIRGLRAENSELKFHLYLHFPELVVGKRGLILPAGSGAQLQIQESPQPPKVLRDAATSAKDGKVKGCIRCGKISSAKLKEKEQSDRQLEIAEKVISELKGMKVNQDKKLILQEIRVQELEKEVQHLKSTGLEIFSLQIPVLASTPITTTNSIPSNSVPSSPSPPTRRRYNSSSSGTHRRPSLESLLPDDYKESVATLPPIGAQDFLKKLTTLPLVPVALNSSKLCRYRSPPLPLPGSIVTSPASSSHRLQPLKAGLQMHKSNAT